MALLSVPDRNIQVSEPKEIQQFLKLRGIFFDQWSCDIHFEDNASTEAILKAYDKDLLPFMKNGGYETADVISINSTTDNYDAIRTKFLAEHTHTEDEIRFFVDGSGLFWFNLETEPVFNVLCERGDLISVPAGSKHWFDAGEKNPFVKAIRIFIDMSGWVPHYTESKIELKYLDFKVERKMKDVKCVLMDIEGTTTSVSFVYEVLFPYFQKNIHLLAKLKNVKQVKLAFDQVREIVLKEEGKEGLSVDEIIAYLLQWSKEDRKVIPLKTVQGILWETAYKTSEIKGHVFEDVPSRLMDWKNNGIRMGVFSSGSIDAQRLLFGYSETGDLNKYFSFNFDTNTGSKRESETYQKIASIINLEPQSILFLSDIVEELEAADKIGFQTIQLVRETTVANWPNTVTDFLEINLE